MHHLMWTLLPSPCQVLQCTAVLVSQPLSCIFLNFFTLTPCRFMWVA